MDPLIVRPGHALAIAGPIQLWLPLSAARLIAESAGYGTVTLMPSI
jgi:hypothetical protein